jgi:Protein of unknown function (DUF3540)
MPTLELPMPTGAVGSGVRLGPAVVTSLDGERVTVVFAGATHHSRLALGYAYQPLAGDLVLIILQEDDAYIIGVLSGRGTTTLTAHGDLTIAAPNGRIQLQAGNGIALAAPKVEVQAQAIEMTAVSLGQRVQSAFLAVTDLLHITAGQRQTRIAGTSMETTERSYHRSDKEVVIQGESVSIT